MTKQRPRRARILTNVKISEVSAVDRGAGEGCDIKLLKRASTNAAITNATGRLAMSVESILADADCDKDAMLAKTFSQFQDHLNTLMKRYPKNANLDVAVDAAGPDEGMPDERDQNDEDDEDADEDDEPTDNDGADENGAPTKNLERLRDAMKGTTMRNDPLRKLKSLDVVKICKQISADGDSHSLSEHELVAMIDNYAKAHDFSFAKMFERNDETGLALRKAVDIAKNAQWISKTSTTSTMSKSVADGLPGKATLAAAVSGGRAARAVDNPKTALAQLQALVDAQRAAHPALSESEAWQRVYEHPDNRELAQRERQENRPVATAW